jgi:hypothetical protein
MGLIALSMLLLWTAISLATGRVWIGVVLTAWFFSALYLSSILDDVRSVAWHVQSFGGHGFLSWTSDAFRNLTSTVQAQSFGIDFEIRMLIGLGLVAAAALYSRRPLAA